MIKDQLDKLISQTLEELKKVGMSKSTIKAYRYSAYSPIKNYCFQQGITCYDPATVDTFLYSQKKRLEDNEISKRHYRKLRRAVLMLKEFSQQGVLQWRYYSNRSRYRINEYFSLYLRQFLDTQDVSKGTIANRRSIIRHFLNHIEHNGHSDFNLLSPKNVKDYLSVAAETHLVSTTKTSFFLFFDMVIISSNFWTGNTVSFWSF